jgi:glutathione reductase (NADPH)
MLDPFDRGHHRASAGRDQDLLCADGKGGSLMADFDLIVIGAGSGGVRAARVAAAYGARVAIAEEHKVGGTCVIRGCVPKKLLVYGAHFAEDLDDAAMFGWDVPTKRFDWPTLRDNVLSEVSRLNKAYTETRSEARCRGLRPGKARL